MIKWQNYQSGQLNKQAVLISVLGHLLGEGGGNVHLPEGAESQPVEHLPDVEHMPELGE